MPSITQEQGSPSSPWPARTFRRISIRVGFEITFRISCTLSSVITSPYALQRRNLLEAEPKILVARDFGESLGVHGKRFFLGSGFAWIEPFGSVDGGPDAVERVARDDRSVRSKGHRHPGVQQAPHPLEGGCPLRTQLASVRVAKAKQELGLHGAVDAQA